MRIWSLCFENISASPKTSAVVQKSLRSWRCAPFQSRICLLFGLTSPHSGLSSDPAGNVSSLEVLLLPCSVAERGTEDNCLAFIGNYSRPVPTWSYQPNSHVFSFNTFFAVQRILHIRRRKKFFEKIIILLIFLTGLSFAFVGYFFVILRDIWIQTQRDAVAAALLPTQPPILLTQPPIYLLFFLASV